MTGTGAVDGTPGAVSDKSIHYKDVALIRERILPEEAANIFDGHKQDLIRVVNEHGFMNTF